MKGKRDMERERESIRKGSGGESEILNTIP